MKILVVEDDPTIRQMIAKLLARRGYPCSLAEDGMKAVEAWQEGGFDLILMDVQMPTVDGMEAARMIREQEATRGGHVPIVAMTAYTLPEDQAECLAAGMDGFITKPLIFDELLSLIESYDPDRKRG